jgi:putative ABC transport system substrate-binding protein
MNKRLIILWLIILLSTPCIDSLAAESTKSVQVAILVSDSLKSTIRTLQGAKSLISRQQPSVVYHEFMTAPELSANQSLIDSIGAIGPRVILSVGSSATKLAVENFQETAVVFSSVKYPSLSGFVSSPQTPSDNVTGASLDISVRVQFNYFQKIIPELRKIGILYTDLTAALIEPAREEARSLGLELVAIRISDKREVPGSLDSLAQICDGLWSLADPDLFSPQSAKFILLNASRKGIPLMGFSRYVVESGALFALDFDYKAVGRQAGEIVSRVINGAAPGRIEVTSPDFIWFHYNENTARHISVEIPEDLVAIAKEVYR